MPPSLHLGLLLLLAAAPPPSPLDQATDELAAQVTQGQEPSTVALSVTAPTAPLREAVEDALAAALTRRQWAVVANASASASASPSPSPSTSPTSSNPSIGDAARASGADALLRLRATLEGPGKNTGQGNQSGAQSEAETTLVLSGEVVSTRPNFFLQRVPLRGAGSRRVAASAPADGRLRALAATRPPAGPPALRPFASVPGRVLALAVGARLARRSTQGDRRDRLPAPAPTIAPPGTSPTTASPFTSPTAPPTTMEALEVVLLDAGGALLDRLALPPAPPGPRVRDLSAFLTVEGPGMDRLGCAVAGRPGLLALSLQQDRLALGEAPAASAGALPLASGGAGRLLGLLDPRRGTILRLALDAPGGPTRRPERPLVTVAAAPHPGRTAFAALRDDGVLELLTSQLTAASPPLSGVGAGFALADLDGDGEPEVVASSAFPGPDDVVRVLRTGSPATLTLESSLPVGSALAGAAGDVTGDGLDDALLAAVDPGGASTRLWVVSAGVTPGTTFTAGAAPGTRSPAPAGSNAGARPRHGGELRLLLPPGPRALDPAQATGPDQLLLARAVGATLLDLDPAGAAARPALLEAFSPWKGEGRGEGRRVEGSYRPPRSALLAGPPVLEPGGRAVRLRLSPNLRFHDGAPVTAASVAASLTRLAAPGSPGAWLLAPVEGAAALHAGRSSALAGVRVEGELELRIALAHPYPQLPWALAAAPASVVRASPAGRLAGAGPFRPALATGGALRLEAFEAHHAGPPFADRLIVSSAAAREAAGALGRAAADLALVPEPPLARGGDQGQGEGEATPRAPLPDPLPAMRGEGGLDSRVNPGITGVVLAAVSRRSSAPRATLALLATLDRERLARDLGGVPLRQLLPPPRLPAAPAHGSPAVKPPPRAAPPAAGAPDRLRLAFPQGAGTGGPLGTLAARLQLALHERGVRVALEPMPPAELAARLSAGTFEVALVPVWLASPESRARPGPGGIHHGWIRGRRHRPPGRRRRPPAGRAVGPGRATGGVAPRRAAVRAAGGRGSAPGGGGGGPPG